MAFDGQVAKGVRVYRFHDAVAVNIMQKDGYAETFYVPHELAHHFAALVQDVANDITHKGFGSSDVGTMVAEQPMTPRPDQRGRLAETFGVTVYKE